MQSISIQPFRLEQTSTTLQVEYFLVNKSELLLLFEDHYQLWDMTHNLFLHKQQLTKFFLYSSQQVVITSTSLAVISLLSNKTRIYISDIQASSETLISETEGSLYDSLSIHCFQQSGLIMVQKTNIDMQLLVWALDENKQYKRITQKYLYKDTKISKYNEKDTVLAMNEFFPFSFELINMEVGAAETYDLKGVFQVGGRIHQVKQYSAKEAVVGSVNRESDSSVVVVFNLSSKQVLKLTKICYVFDTIIDVGWCWIARSQTTKRDIKGGQSVSLEVARLFAREEESSVTIDALSGKICVNNIYPILVLIDTEQSRERQVVEIAKVDYVPGKRNYYIYLLEESGLIGAFGSEVVNSTLYNFEGQQL